MVQPLVADVSRARQLFPQIEPISYEKAVRLALRRIQEQAVETRWTGTSTDQTTYEHSDLRGLIREVRSLHVQAPPDDVFRVFTSLGGERGWLTWNWAWRVRGMLDRIVGGPGLGRGRRHPQELLAGEAVDFWRVEAVKPPHLLRLRAEARMPGRGWLQWEAVPEEGGTRLTQVAAFAPRGLTGALYWYTLYPFHQYIFSALIDRIAALSRNARVS
jgi:hypothetical protein